ncbi:MAG: hypothetical protein QOC67_2801, partial [Pseudonocardiales bacterium]|nr:hypothetical protein [Pseudonocardiales bacterium]
MDLIARAASMTVHAASPSSWGASRVNHAAKAVRRRNPSDYLEPILAVFIGAIVLSVVLGWSPIASLVIVAALVAVPAVKAWRA